MRILKKRLSDSSAFGRTLLALCAATWLGASSASGSFIIEPNGLASGNFFATNGTGSSTQAGEPTLMAIGLTNGVASVFGGEPYIYTYTPSTDTDNMAFTAGTVFNSAAGLSSSGMTGGAAGAYNVYLTYPQSGNNTDMPALYDVDVDGDGTADLSSSYNQNVADLTTGMGIGLWELVGQINVTDPAQAITLTISPSNLPAGFVGVRTAGVMFEAVPEPASASLLALAGFGIAVLARRK